MDEQLKHVAKKMAKLMEMAVESGDLELGLEEEMRETLEEYERAKEK